MKLAMNVIAVLLILTGAVWFLQGINILPGSYMTGQIEWAFYGGLAILAGAGLLFLGGRRRQPPAG